MSDLTYCPEGHSLGGLTVRQGWPSGGSEGKMAEEPALHPGRLAAVPEQPWASLRSASLCQISLTSSNLSVLSGN